MKNQKELELIKQMEILRETMFAISEIWSEESDDINSILEVDYPFSTSLDELAIEVAVWSDVAQDNIVDHIEYKKIAFADMLSTKESLEVNGENIERFSDIGLGYDDLHMGKFDTKIVHIYNEFGYILEGVRLDSGKKVFITYVSNEDYESPILKEIETALFERHTFGELYRDIHTRDMLVRKAKLGAFVKKITDKM
jgi:hypothetical protein